MAMNPLSGFSVHDPKKLTKKQLLTVLHIGPEHRIVDMGDKAIIVDWDAVMDSDLFTKDIAWGGRQ